MSEQINNIKTSAGFIKNKFPKNFKPVTGIVSESNFNIFGEFKVLSEIDFSDIPGFNVSGKGSGKVLFARSKGIKSSDVLIYKGRLHYYEEASMRDIGHTVYVMKYLGVKKLISVDESGHLNPRYNCGEIALIYDHINLTGDNPLIGRNEDELGLRFPDMSNAYNKELHEKIYKILQERQIRINDAVILGISGPQSETEAEARFYRDIGADVVGYSMVSENIASVHCGIKFAGIGIITRELVADVMLEDQRSEIQKNKDKKNSLKKAEKIMEKLIADIIDRI
ncbi:MAG TPA: purine-nucleoside phosphorylase [Ignavibacteria bacterium]|nr:purine-nucleoside phosphorylase [Ignavibacteria bacterium]HMR40584.1 purine-nucleoside phosphorylase [Ignavibacteria bacterium]